MKMSPLYLGADKGIPLRRYNFHSIFSTIQGEGYHAGRKAVFARTNACNVWSGKEEHRERDSKNSACAICCDTQFFGVDESNGGGHFTSSETVGRANALWGPEYLHRRFLVISGGEPSLTVDYELVSAFQGAGWKVSVETNGSKRLPEGINWITLSPKPPMLVVDQFYSEVKVLSIFDPTPWKNYAGYLYVQPVDFGNKEQNEAEMAKCVKFVLENPAWKISCQIHKLLQIQ
jgi:7-carboxy-7-deazaguanine synthase